MAAAAPAPARPRSQRSTPCRGRNRTRCPSAGCCPTWSPRSRPPPAPSPYCASNWLRNTLNSWIASWPKLMTGLPQIASSTLPPSISVVNPLRGSAMPPKLVTVPVSEPVPLWPAGFAPGSSCASTWKLRDSTGRSAICCPVITDDGCDLLTSTSGDSPTTVTLSSTAATPSLKSIVASVSTVSTICLVTGAKPDNSTRMSYGAGCSAIAR